MNDRDAEKERESKKEFDSSWGQYEKRRRATALRNLEWDMPYDISDKFMAVCALAATRPCSFFFRVFRVVVLNPPSSMS